MLPGVTAASLLCSAGAEMRIVSIITPPRVADRMLRHLRSGRCRVNDPPKSHAPPRAAALSRQWLSGRSAGPDSSPELRRLEVYPAVLPGAAWEGDPGAKVKRLPRSLY